ncbi:DUF262 domain-containing protein [Rhodococcus pyridinivorans]|uniref:GmrSD restriction endonuclease domain-containing protein n=1 Tax=Rhodococcus pyridinivorans TaxID=103816 RepID=UPI0036AF0B7C
MPKLSTLLDEIDSGTVLLPEFQRGYVWNRDQVRGLMRSLYRSYPVGGLLMWETATSEVAVRGEITSGGVRQLLLDGQQRVTSLYGVVRGTPPPFFEGDPSAFTGLYFNVESEVFEFYRPTTMAEDPCWVSVTQLFREGLKPFFMTFTEHADKANTYLDRLNTLSQILQREFNVEKITGSDKSVDEVVDIFNRVNSGGTKLSKGDLALASLCAQWPPARQEMRDHLAVWKKAGFDFTLDWLLRNATAVARGRALFTALSSVQADEFERALTSSVAHIGTFLDAISGRLGLDHDRVLMGRYAIPVVSRLLELNGGRFTDAAHRDKVLYWYVHSALWGRFSGSTESYLQQDYDTVRDAGVDGLISTLERLRGGKLEVLPHDFDGSTRGSRFYPLLYLLTRVKGARDFGSGLELRAELLGKLTSLQVHHIFPKAYLRDHYDRSQVNAIANFCFLTQATNLEIGKRAPEEYFAEVEAKNPGVLASQWIPTDPALWTVDRYPDFLAARRELLAEAAQSFLEELRSGSQSVGESLQPLAVTETEPDDPRTLQIQAMIAELRDLGFAEPEVDTEITDPTSGRFLSMAEAFWPDGLQHGVGDPVILELDPDEADLPRLEELGYKVFTSVDALLGFVNNLNEAAAGITEAPEPAATSEPIDDDTTELETEFGSRVRALYDRARREAGYNATQFISMVANIGPLATAKKLLASRTISDGFSELWERGRIDLTVEALIIEPAFEALFTDAELDIARHRLTQFGYVPSSSAPTSSRPTRTSRDVSAPSNGSSTLASEKPEWNGQDWYVCLGEVNDSRNWDDARKYGFVSAGGGRWYSDTLKNLQFGDRVFVYVPKVGYVGAGTVAGSAAPADQATLEVDGKKVNFRSLDLVGPYTHEIDNPDPDEDYQEWIVPVVWERTVDRESALREAGLFANQHSACRLRDEHTLNRVTEFFGVTHGDRVIRTIQD